MCDNIVRGVYEESIRRSYEKSAAGLRIKQIGTCGENRNVRANIGRWERGEVMPNIDFCVRLAEYYGITVDELIGRAPKE